jgi:mRNA interferase RelE/StbE
MYEVKLKPQAQKFINQQSLKVKRQLIKKIETLKENPRPAGSKPLNSEKNIYRVRSGNYRIIYQIRDKELIVIVAKAGDRKDIYENLKYLIKALLS